MPKNTRVNNLTSAAIKEGASQIQATRRHNEIRSLRVGDFCRLLPRLAEKYPDQYAYIVHLGSTRHYLQLQGFHLDGSFDTSIIIRRNTEFLVCCTQDLSFFRPLARDDFSHLYPCPDDYTPPSPINSLSFPHRRDGIYVPKRFCPETDIRLQRHRLNFTFRPYKPCANTTTPRSSPISFQAYRNRPNRVITKPIPISANLSPSPIRLPSVQDCTTSSVISRTSIPGHPSFHHTFTIKPPRDDDADIPRYTAVLPHTYLSSATDIPQVIRLEPLLNYTVPSELHRRCHTGNPHHYS